MMKSIQVPAVLALSVLFVFGMNLSASAEKIKPNEGVKPGMNQPKKDTIIAGEYYSVWFKQDGQIVPVKNHTVTLRKKPFSIFIAFHKCDHLQINFNLDPYIYNGFAHGLPIWEIIKPLEKFMGMAESDFNADKDIFLSEYSCHYWYYTSDGDHRFNNITKENGTIIGERIVEKIFTQGDDEAVPVEDFKGDTIYAVFIYLSNQFDSKIKLTEYQKDYVKIKFEN